MPRKFLVVALALAGALAVAGVAYAANVYNITQGDVSGGGKGTKFKPVAKSLKFAYTVKDSTQPRGKPVSKYKIAVEGITGKYAKYVAKCKYSDANNPNEATAASKCKKAKVGSGKVENLAGPGTDQTNNSFCNLKLTLYNIGTGLAIRLDGDPPGPSSQDGPVGCTLPVHQAIKAKFNTIKLDKVETSSLDFSVPSVPLRHPLGANGNFDNVVANTVATVNKKTAKAKIKGKDGKKHKRTVGLYSAIGCHKGQRTVQVKFTDETGAQSTKTAKTGC
jgi:hypothetical protein